MVTVLEITMHDRAVVSPLGLTLGDLNRDESLGDFEVRLKDNHFNAFKCTLTLRQDQ